jgi:hypothetical protein
VKAAGDDLDIAVAHSVDESMLLVDPALGEPGQFTPQQFWLADGRVAVALDVLDQAVDPAHDLASDSEIITTGS